MVYIDGLPNETPQLKLPATVGRKSQCVLFQYGDTSLHRGSQSAEKHPTGSTFTCSKTSLPLSLRETEMVFTHLFLLPACSCSGIYRGAAGSLACMCLKAGKYPIHHRDSEDKHIYTNIFFLFFSPDLHVFSLLSHSSYTLWVLLSLFIVLTSNEPFCTIIDFFYLIENYVHSD